MNKYVYNLLIIFFFFAQKTNAQSVGTYQIFQNITLSPEASVVTFFTQDAQGMVWIGSHRGLFSFDGYNTQEHFIYGEASNSYIHCGVMMDDQQLWLGTDNGILIYDCKKDHYIDYPVYFPANIRALALAGKKLWIGTLDGLYCFDTLTKELQFYDTNQYPAIPHQTVYSILTGQDKNVYIGTYDGWCYFSPAKEEFIGLPLPVNTQKNNQFVNSLLEDITRNCIWIGMEGGLLKYDLRTNEILEIKELQDNSVKTLGLDANGALLAGTDNGLYVYSESAPLQHIMHDSRNTNSLSNNIIWNVFTDRDHNIWLGTDSGVSFFAYNKDFRFVPISQITGTGEGNHFYSIFRDSRNNFWLGGTNGLIRIQNMSDNRPVSEWHKVGDPTYPVPHNRIRHIYEDKSSHLWIATDASILRYDYNKHQFIHYNITDSNGVYNSNWAYYIFEDDNEQLWIATCLGGIFVVNKEKLLQSAGGTCTADISYTLNNGLSSMFVNQIIPDHSGMIWALLYNNANGVDKINPVTGHIIQFPIKEFTDNQSPNYLICDTQGILWIGFRGGILRINPENNHIQPIHFNAFSNSEVLAITEVENNIWVSTTDGLWIISKENLDCKRLPVMDRMFTTLYFDKINESIYMGGIDGFAVSSPALLYKDDISLPVHFTSLYINGDLTGHEHSVSPNSIRYANQIQLNHKQNNLLIEVSDYPYSLQEKSKFVYYLEGLDKQWNQLKPNNNRISYNNLPYGNYRLIVSKLGVSGTPSEVQSTLHIEIRPPWYLSIWARIIYTLLIIGLTGWIINFFRVKHRLRIERIEKEKIKEQTQLKIDFFTHISHDLKTPLSLILAPVSKMLHEAKDVKEKKQLETVQRNAIRLNSLIHQVLDFNRIEDQADTCLILSKTDLVSFTHTICQPFIETGKARGLTLSFSTNKETIFLDLDVIKFESVITNLISNAYKYTPDGGTICVSLYQDDTNKQIRLTIEDTGIGIPEQDIPYIFQRFYQSSKTSHIKEGTGVGLYMVKTYTELHDGSVTIESTEGKGSRFTLTLPIRKPDTERISHQKEHTTSGTKKATILIVEDNPDITAFLVSILEKQYVCYTAGNGREGLKTAREIQPTLIIADLMMPEMNGLEMCRELKKNISTSTIPIIMLTAKSDIKTELESIHLNIDAFIAKPFEPDIILSRIAQLLKNKEAYQLKSKLEDIATPSQPEIISPDEKLLAGITAIIEDHIADTDLNVNAVCKISGISNKQLYRKLKQLTGLTPVDYIKSIRMKKAAMLLQQQKFTVAEVMYMVGFSNHSYFSKCFQSEFGKTPRQYLQVIEDPRQND